MVGPGAKSRLLLRGGQQLVADVHHSPEEALQQPLHLAAAFGHVHTVNVLLEHGADPTRLNLNKQSPLFSALLLPIAHAPECIANKEKVLRGVGKDLTGKDIGKGILCHHPATESVDGPLARIE